MQTEKPQPEGKQILLETRITEFPALSVDSRVGIFRSASETDVGLIFLPMTLKLFKYHSLFLLFMILTPHYDLLHMSFGVFFFFLMHVTSLLKFKILTSFLTWRVSCLGPWARKKYPTSLKLEQILSHT